jgi:CheY-like chemotaxis protein
MAKVLIVDDTRVVRDVLGRFIEREGHEVLLAESGRQGIERFQSTRPDLVLTDVEMPDINGLVVLDAIRNLDAEVPVIVISATYQGRDFPRTKNTIFVSKADGLNRMMEAIRRYLPRTDKKPASPQPHYAHS